MLNKILIFLSAFLALTSYASGFFFGGGTSEQSTPPTRFVYQKRFLQSPSYTIIDPERRQPIPSVPIQVPLQAQMAPLSNIHNVQLVPCLCPISPDNSYENQPQYDYIYVAPSPQLPQHSIQQQNQQVQK